VLTPHPAIVPVVFMVRVAPDNEPLPLATPRMTELQFPTVAGGHEMAWTVNSVDLVAVAAGPVPSKQKSPMVNSVPCAVMWV